MYKIRRQVIAKPVTSTRHLLASVLLLLFSFVAVADPLLAAGKKKARLCTSCHGPLGVSRSPSYPDLAGQKAEYLAKQLRDFKTDKRQDPQMSRLAKSLSEQEINELSLWFANLKRNK